MITRSNTSSTKSDPQLDLFSIGGVVALKQAVAFIPENAHNIERFDEVIDLLEGREVKDLTPEERKFVELVITMGNKYLVITLYAGGFSDSLWSDSLQKSVARYSRKILCEPTQNVRKQGREFRRYWFQKIRELIACLLSPVTLQFS